MEGGVGRRGREQAFLLFNLLQPAAVAASIISLDTPRLPADAQLINES